MVINTLPWPRAEITRLPEAVNSKAGTRYGILHSGDGTGHVEILSNSSPASEACIEEVAKGVFMLSNNEYKVMVDEGYITSLVDIRADRELIPYGEAGNKFVLFDDKPLYWQAWDVEVYHLDAREELRTTSVEISERGPNRVSIVTKTKISDASWVKSTISLAASIEGQPSYIEIESEVEWQESMKFLKVEYPVDIRSTEASYETQFGVVKRPTHYNTR